MNYRKGRELIDQVAEDLSSYDDQGLIDYSKLYKILRRCNATLGLRINPEKTEMIQIKEYKGYVPEDFKVLNHAFLCKEKVYDVCAPKKVYVEYQTLCTGDKKTCSPCLTEDCGDYAIYQLLDDNWTQFKQLEVCRATTKSFNKCTTSCPNLFSKSGNEFEIQDDGTVVTNFQNGHLYINYMGTLEDSDEDLLVLDDPLVEPYYEAELTRQILKFIAYNKDGDVANIYGDAKIEASRAKITAISYVNAIGYKELQETYKAERDKLFAQYFRPILDNNC